jgi:hypothetical protein
VKMIMMMVSGGWGGGGCYSIIWDPNHGREPGGNVGMQKNPH